MKNIVFIILILLKFVTYGQNNKFKIEEYNYVLKGDTIELPVLKREGLYYLESDTNKLATGTFKYTYEENSLIKAHYLNGRCLKETVYYENENIHSELIYENNKVKDGVYTFYYDTGERMEEKVYRNGKLNGACIGYYRSGKIMSVKNYYNGKLDGKIVSFYDNGLFSSEVMIEDGAFKGLKIDYYENGQKAMEKYYLSTFKLGGGCSKTWYRNGKLAWKVCYDKEGVKYGFEKAYDEWGFLKYQKTWKDGKVKSKEQFGSLDNLWLPNKVEGHRVKMQYYFDKDDW